MDRNSCKGDSVATVPFTTQERHDIEQYIKNADPSSEEAMIPWTESSREPPIQPTPYQAPSEDDLMAWKSNDILRIIPENIDARRAMHGLLERKQNGTLSKHHAAYLKTVGKRPVKKKHDPVQPEEGASEHEEMVPEAQEVEELLHDGYFRIGFDCGRVLAGLKWSVGRGKNSVAGQDHREVDVLVAPPDSSMANPTKLGFRHILLDLEPGSGAWRIVAREGITFEDKDLKRTQVHALYRARTRFELNQMTFRIEFAITNREQEIQYLACRQQIIQSGLHDRTMKIYDTAISGIPFDSDILLETIVFRHGLGAGTFGSCYEGFDPTSGHARVVKWLDVKNETTRDRGWQEVLALKTLGGKPGIVKVWGIYTSLKGNPLSRDAIEAPLPLSIWIVMGKGRDFQKVTWEHSILASWENRAWLAKRLLLGLQEIHSKGWMHRDITPQNVLLHYPPLDASLCDFGKVLRVSRSADYAICAADMCPPEITQYQSRPYDQSVDVYLLGQVFAMTWFPDTYKSDQGSRLYLRNAAHHEIITTRLLEARDHHRNHLADLVLSMVAWKPEERLTASQALAHHSLQGIEGPVEEGHGGHKRPADPEVPVQRGKGG